MGITPEGWIAIKQMQKVCHEDQSRNDGLQFWQVLRSGAGCPDCQFATISFDCQPGKIIEGLA